MKVYELIELLAACDRNKEVKLSVSTSFTEHVVLSIAQVRDNPESTTVYLRNYNLGYAWSKQCHK